MYSDEDQTINKTKTTNALFFGIKFSEFLKDAHPYKMVLMCSLVAAHINHIRAVAGVNHVGLGAGYDGINL
jgi:microsomal dipeptidase-like Zn-dependent dipeptidase